MFTGLFVLQFALAPKAVPSNRFEPSQTSAFPPVTAAYVNSSCLFLFPQIAAEGKPRSQTRLEQITGQESEVVQKTESGRTDTRPRPPERTPVSGVLWMTNGAGQAGLCLRSAPVATNSPPFFRRLNFILEGHKKKYSKAR